jgi:hypothetical protein
MTTRRELLAGIAALLLVRDALAQGRVAPGVRRREGDVRIQNDHISTGSDGLAVFVVGRDAHLVRANSEVSWLANGLRVASGAVLSVFAPTRRKEIRTATAVVGIRGTGVYVEAEPQRTYVCTCYGAAELQPIADPAARETVRTRHHEQPRYIMAAGAPQMMMQAPVINHTDAELIMLEALVRRRPPFADAGAPPYK